MKLSSIVLRLPLGMMIALLAVGSNLSDELLSYFEASKLEGFLEVIVFASNLPVFDGFGVHDIAMSCLNHIDILFLTKLIEFIVLRL